MSPLNGILVGDRRHLPAPFSHGAAWCATFLIAFTFACHSAAAAPAGEQAIRDGDARKAETVLSKLRLLYDAADSDDAGAYRKLASKLYPDLFVKVAEMSAGDLSTDLSTAVFLAEKLGRTWIVAGEATADCRVERPDIYLPLCLGLRGGTVRQLLLAKSRLHARWAEAVLKNHRGEADSETARALAEMNAARANDLLIAARAAETLQALGGSLPSPAAGAGRGERFDAAAAGLDGSGGEFADALHAAETLLSWMPRSQTFYHLSSARQAYADGLSWSRKVRQTKRLVISASNGFEPDPLKVLRLDAEQVSATVQANWRSAMRHTRLAEQFLSQPPR
ncbi:MAG TPA: hypothetical protein VF588_20525 [Pyrinomonadaceae bacterium]|jgi:hypothetical protein